MRLTIYGATTCAACKNVLNFAEVKGLEVNYRLIDEDAEAYQDFVGITGSGRADMPVCVLEVHDEVIVSKGLPDGIALVQYTQEVGE